MPRSLNIGEPVLFTWVDETFAISNSFLDTPGTFIRYYDPSGENSDFIGGRDADTLSQIIQYESYEVTPATAIQLPDSALGFGNAYVPAGTPSGTLPNVPTGRRAAVDTAAATAASGQSFTAQDVINTLNSLHTWYSFENASVTANGSGKVSAVANWGTSTAAATQSVDANKPTIRSDGLEFTQNPSQFLLCNLQFLANAQNTLLIREKRAAANARCFLSGSSQNGQESLRWSYGDFNSVNAALQNTANINAFTDDTLEVYNTFVYQQTTTFKISRANGVEGDRKTAANDLLPIIAFPGGAIGVNGGDTAVTAGDGTRENYIGRMSHLILHNGALTESQIIQLERFTDAYDDVNRVAYTPPQATGTITVTLPTANKIYAGRVPFEGADPESDIVINGSFTANQSTATLQAKLGNGDWNTIASNIPPGNFTATLLRKTGTGNLEFRFLNGGAAITTVNNLQILNANPSNVVATSGGAGQITVNWTAPTGFTPISYTIQVQPNTDFNWITPGITVNHPTTTVNFTGLATAGYYIRVITNFQGGSVPVDNSARANNNAVLNVA